MEPVKCQATIDQVKTMKDGGLRVTVDTQILDHELMASLFGMKDQLGWMVFAPQGTKEVEIPNGTVGAIKDPKTKSRRLRAVLYRWWESEGKIGTSEQFYEIKMEYFIDWVKQKLDR